MLTPCPKNCYTPVPMHNKTLIPFLLAFGLLASACTPRVEVAADKPIEINMNINIEHHVKVEIDRDLDKTFTKNSDIF